jgi:hypothetical protein
MKKLIFATCIFAGLFFKGSAQAVIADPAVNFMRTVSASALPVDPFFIPVDSIIELKVPVINYNHINALPAGSCKIKIGLGSKMILNPDFNLSTVNTSNYFTWTAEMTGGQMQITGDLIASLPGNFADTVIFQVKGNILGNSTVTTNFLVTNHNTSVNLSDENGSNNNTSLAYTIIERIGGPLPVTFTKITAIKEACNVKVDFYTENEINVDRFDVELSKNGLDYEKSGSLTAGNAGHYQFRFEITPGIASPNLFIRIKSIDIDGQYQYSDVKRIAGECDSKEKAVIIFPNPTPVNSGYFTVLSEQLFNGSYNIAIMDMSGKLVTKSTKDLFNVNQFTFNYGSLAAAEYIITIQKKNSAELTVIRWQKK